MTMITNSTLVPKRKIQNTLQGKVSLEGDRGKQNLKLSRETREDPTG